MAKSNNNGVINLFGKNDGPQDEQKYSNLLERLIAPFEKEFPEDFYKEDVFELAVSAWNFACLSEVIPAEEFENVMSMAPEQDQEMQLVKKMIDLKIKELKDYDRFIVDFELEERDDEIVLTVMTQEKESYLMAMADEAAAEFDDSDFSEMDHDEGFIDRSAIIVMPKAPFYEWYNALYPEEPMNEGKKANSYLVDYLEDDTAMERWLAKKFDYFFKSELDEWHPNKKDWPKKRTYKMFKEWFEVISCPDVYDTESRPVFKME